VAPGLSSGASRGAGPPAAPLRVSHMAARPQPRTPTRGDCRQTGRRVEGVPPWGPPQAESLMPHSFPSIGNPAEFVGRTPWSRGTP
jgi:hypothetical protein